MLGYPVKQVALSSTVLSYCLLLFVPRSQWSNVFLLNYVTLFVVFFDLQLVSCAIWKILIYPKHFSPIRHLPGPKGGSWWNGQAFRTLTEPNGTAHSEWILNVPNKGIIRYLGILNSELIVVTSADAYAEVLTRNYDFPKDPLISRLAERILGPGLVLAEGDDHRRQRKMLMPAFTAKNVKTLYPLFWEKSKTVTDKIMMAARTNGKARGPGFIKDGNNEVTTLDISKWVSKVALDIITLAALGHDFNSLDNPSNSLAKAYSDVFELDRFAQFLAVLGSFLPKWLVRILPMKKNVMVERASRTIQRACRKTLREKRTKLARKELHDVDLLSVLLRGGEIDDEAAVHQMMTFLAAGHETVTTGISWCIYMLCVHPEWQERLRAEIRNHLPSPASNGDVNSQQIDSMLLLNAFIDEVLRYWPPIPLTIRIAAKDTILAGQFIPGGTKLMLALNGTNKDPKIWGSDASLFKPERWLSPDLQQPDPLGGAKSKYGYLTFMHGPRGCIGKGFAKAEMACILAALVGRFEFDLKHEYERDHKKIKVSGGSVAGKPVNGMWVKMKPVGGW